MMTPLLFALAFQTAPEPPQLPAGWIEREIFNLAGGSGGFGFSNRLEAEFRRRSPYPVATDNDPAAYWVVHVARRHMGLPGQPNESFEGWLDERRCPQVRRAVERIAAFRPPPSYAADSVEQGMVVGMHGTQYVLKAWGGADARRQVQITTYDPNGGLLADLTWSVQDDLKSCL